MDEPVDGLRSKRRLQLVDAGIDADRAVSLSRVGEVSDQGPAPGIGSQLQVDVEYLVTRIEQLLQYPCADLAAAACDDDPFHPTFLVFASAAGLAQRPRRWVPVRERAREIYAPHA